MNAVGWITFGIGTFIGVGGIVIGYLLYVRALRDKEPAWDIKTTNLIRDYRTQLPELSVRYGQEEVKNLSTSRLVFLNRGKGTIRSEDITPEDPVRIVISGEGKLLATELLDETKPTNNLDLVVSSDGKSALFKFSYLDHNHGGVFQIVHTGTANSDLRMTGTVIGAENIQPRALQPSRVRKFVDGATSYVAIIPVVAGVGLAVNTADSFWQGIAIVAASFALSVGLIFVLVKATELSPPQGLEAFRE